MLINTATYLSVWTLRLAPQPPWLCLPALGKQHQVQLSVELSLTLLPLPRTIPQIAALTTFRNSGFGLPCPYPNCGKTYEASDFTTHVKARHTQDAQTFACPLCTLLGVCCFVVSKAHLFQLHYAVTPQTNLVQHLQHGHADLWNAPVTLIASKPSSPPVTSNTRVNLVHVHRPPVPSRLPVQVAKDEKLEPETTGKVEITVVPKKEKSPKSSRHDSEGSAKSPKDEKASRRSDSKDKSEKGSTTPNSKEKRTRKVSRSDPHVRREKHSDKSHDDNNIKVTLTKSDITTGEKKIKRKTQEKKTSREHKGGRRHSTPNQDSKLDTTTTTTTATFTSTTSTPATPPTSPSPTGPLMTTPTVSSSGDYLSMYSTFVIQHMYIIL